MSTCDQLNKLNKEIAELEKANKEAKKNLERVLVSYKGNVSKAASEAAKAVNKEFPPVGDGEFTNEQIIVEEIKAMASGTADSLGIPGNLFNSIKSIADITPEVDEVLVAMLNKAEGSKTVSDKLKKLVTTIRVAQNKAAENEVKHLQEVKSTLKKLTDNTEEKMKIDSMLTATDSPVVGNINNIGKDNTMLPDDYGAQMAEDLDNRRSEVDGLFDTDEEKRGYIRALFNNVRDVVNSTQLPEHYDFTNASMVTNMTSMFGYASDNEIKGNSTGNEHILNSMAVLFGAKNGEYQKDNKTNNTAVMRVLRYTASIGMAQAMQEVDKIKTYDDERLEAIKPQDKTTDEFRSDLMNNKVPTNLLVRMLGRIAYAQMGVKFNKDAPVNMRAAMETALGQAAVHIASLEGNKYINELHKVKDAEGEDTNRINAVTLNRGKIANTVSKLALKENDNGKQELNTIKYYEVDYGGRKLYNREAPKAKTTIVNSDTELDAKTIGRIEAMNAVPHVMDTELFDTLVAGKSDPEVLKMFGWVDVEAEAKKRFIANDEYNEIVGTNTKLENDLVHLKDLRRRLKGSKDKVYFDNAVTKPGRTTIRNAVNIQESKLHRAFVMPESQFSEANRVKYDDLKPQQKAALYNHIAQALDEDPDKLGVASIRKVVDRYIKLAKLDFSEGEPNEKEQAILDGISAIRSGNTDVVVISKAISSGEGFHTINALKALVDIADNKPVYMIGEADAITDGPHRLALMVGMEFGKNNILEKGGILTQERYDKYMKYVEVLLPEEYKLIKEGVPLTMGAIIEAGKKHQAMIKEALYKEVGEERDKAVDKARDIANIIADEKIDDVLSESDAFLDVYTTGGIALRERLPKAKEKMSEKTAKKLKDEESKLSYEFMKGFFGKLELKDLRSIMKSPVMTKGYGAKLYSIVQSKIKDMLFDKKNGVLPDMLERALKGEVLSENELKFVNSMFDELVKSEVPINRALFKNKANEPTVEFMTKGNPDEATPATKLRALQSVDLNSGAVDKTKNGIQELLSGPLEDALKDLFGQVDTMTDDISVVEFADYSAYMTLLRDKVDKLIARKKELSGTENGLIPDDNYITVNELKEVAKELEAEGVIRGSILEGSIQDLTKKGSPEVSQTAEYVMRPKGTIEQGTDNVQLNVNVLFNGLNMMVNPGAAPTTYIHATDGRDMRDVLMGATDKGALTNIYDAIIAGLADGYHLGTGTYNKNYVHSTAENDMIHNKITGLATKIQLLENAGLLDKFYKVVSPNNTSMDYNNEVIRFQATPDRITEAVNSLSGMLKAKAAMYEANKGSKLKVAHMSSNGIPFSDVDINGRNDTVAVIKNKHEEVNKVIGEIGKVMSEAKESTKIYVDDGLEVNYILPKTEQNQYKLANTLKSGEEGDSALVVDSNGIITLMEMVLDDNDMPKTTEEKVELDETTAAVIRAMLANDMLVKDKC